MVMDKPVSPPWRGRAVVATASGTLIALIALLAGAPARPIGLYNLTPSEPLGWYWRSSAAVRPGAIVAFKPPPPASQFFQGALPRSFLKTVAAGPGAVVCAASGAIFINGARRGAVLPADARGRVLPHWSGCRRLGAHDYFLLSDRVPNSFDSRYYGPIARADILGVYAPLAAALGARRP
jgi:conjugative transfer signal peptidase TraF